MAAGTALARRCRVERRGPGGVDPWRGHPEFQRLHADAGARVR